MIIILQIGNLITPIRHINPTMVAHWKDSKECGKVGGGLLPGDEMRVVELSKVPGAMWVRAEIPGSFPAASLKMTGEEYALNFRFLR